MTAEELAREFYEEFQNLAKNSGGKPILWQDATEAERRVLTTVCERMLRRHPLQQFDKWGNRT